MARKLRVILVKPSKYALDGSVERFRWGFMPNSTLTYLRSMTPPEIDGIPCEVTAIDEYVQTDLDYLSLFRKDPAHTTLVALVGVQSHQFPRALDIAAFARANGVEGCVIGGPHVITCDTSDLQERGVSFALAEAESVWASILQDALAGELHPVYGENSRWHEHLDPPVLKPLPKRDLRRYTVPLMGLYPARGCPFTCNFCSVIQIAGRKIRSQPVETTIASLRAAKNAGVRMVMFTSDNFNKYPEAPELLQRMIDEQLRLPFFVQCDAQVYRQPELLKLLGLAGCFQIFVGVESFSRDALRGAHKLQNRPDHYAEIIELCRANGITSHFSNIIGFPGDTRESIIHHLDALKSLNPDVASFYILTPIPGTEQYGDFLRDGWITETNLDRFDGSCVTWQHPVLAEKELHELLMHCYRSYYSASRALKNTARVVRNGRDYRMPASMVAVPGYAVLSRLAARRGDHPMSGGTLRIRLDKVADYADYRRRTYGIDLVPLPGNLPLRTKVAAD